MVPLFKLFSLMIRIFTKPVTNQFKTSMRARKVHNPYTTKFLSALGQRHNAFSIRVHRFYTRMAGWNSYVKPLTEDKAIDQGTEFLGEMIAYGLLLSVGVYELVKYQREARKKEKEQMHVLDGIRQKVLGIRRLSEEVLREIKEMERNVWGQIDDWDWEDFGLEEDEGKSAGRA